jgi:hypothetical protein
MRRYWLARGLKFVVFVTLAITVASVVVMTLWNWVMPATFGLPVLTVGRAFALLLLSRLLLGGFSSRMGRGMHWRHRMRERWEQMSPEERERFMAGMQRGCGGFASRTTEPVA